MMLATGRVQPDLKIESVSGNVSGRASADATSLVMVLEGCKISLHANPRAEQLAVWQLTAPGACLIATAGVMFLGADAGSVSDDRHGIAVFSLAKPGSVV
jgi:hypothetical protein